MERVLKWRGEKVCARSGYLLLGEAVEDEVGDALGGGRIEVGEHGYGVAGAGADLQHAVHAGGSSAVTEAASAVDPAVLEAEGVGVVGGSGLAGGEQFQVGGVEELVLLERIGEVKEVFDGGVAASG